MFASYLVCHLDRRRHFDLTTRPVVRTLAVGNAGCVEFFYLLKWGHNESASNQLFAARVRFVLIQSAAATKPENCRAIYQTKVPIDTLVSLTSPFPIEDRCTQVNSFSVADLPNVIERR